MVQAHFVSCKVDYGSEDRFWNCRNSPLVG